MNIDELAAELHALVVTKGRRGGSGNDYAGLPKLLQDAWKASARDFANDFHITLEAVDETVLKVGDRIEIGHLPRFSREAKQGLFGKKGVVTKVSDYYFTVSPDDGGRSILFMADEIHKLYTCERCSNKSEHYLSDKVTHNQYHDDVDAGRPSRFASDLDDWKF